MRIAIHQALRRSLRAPGFALAVLLLVAAVVAVNATAFSALHALRWKALPYHEGERLVELQANLPGFGFRMGLSEPLYEQVRTDGSTFSGAVGFAGNVFTQNDEAGNGWRIQRITHDFDQVLGVGPILGRAFGPEDAADGREGILLISSHIWNSRFDASPEVIGRALKIGKREYTIVGVMPPSFVFPSAVAHAWMPYVPTAAERTNYEQGSLGDFEVAARLAPGASPEQALERLGAIMANAENLAGLRQSGGLEASVRLWRDRFAGTYWQSIALLQLAALFLLIVVAANVGNLVLDRVVARQREISVCRALGARRRDVALSVSADVVVPGVLGVTVGLLLVPAGIKLLRARQLLPNDMPVDVAIDVPTIVAAMTVTLACLTSSLVVALKVAHASKSGSLNERATMGGLGRARVALLIGQVTLCTALVGGAGLLLRSAVNVVNVDPGFRADGVVVAAIDPMGYARGVEPDVMSDPEVLAPQLAELLRQVKAQPGVTSASIAGMPPFLGGDRVSTLRVPGVEEELKARFRDVGPEYFSVLEIRILAGRAFTEHDAAADASVIIDEVFVNRHFPGVDPIGRIIQLPAAEGEYRDLQVIGVVSSVKHQSLEEEEGLPTFYRLATAPMIPSLVVRTVLQAENLAREVPGMVKRVMPGAEVAFNRPLVEAIAGTLTSRRALVEAVGLFAVLTVALAALGLYAVLSFAVRRRTSEIGVRMALGANRPRILRMVMGQGGVMIAAGVASGLAAGIPLARLLADRLFRLTPGDPLTWTLTAAVVALAALFACWWPARRATRVPPRVALQSD